MAAAALGLLLAACGYESEVALHNQSEAVRPPHLLLDTWAGDCQRGETGEDVCLFPILGRPDWLTVRFSGRDKYSYYAIPRRALDSMRKERAADEAGVVLSPRKVLAFSERRHLDDALGELILMFESLDRLPAVERCRLPSSMLPFSRPTSWGC